MIEKSPHILILLLLSTLLLLVRIPVVDELPDEYAIDERNDRVVDNHVRVARLLNRCEYARNASEELKNERECRQHARARVRPVRVDLNQLAGRRQEQTKSV